MSEFTDYDNDEALVRYANIKRKVIVSIHVLSVFIDVCKIAGVVIISITEQL